LHIASGLFLFKFVGKIRQIPKDFLIVTLLLKPSMTPLENCFLGGEVIEDELAMSPQGEGELFHGLNPRAHEPPTLRSP
jgi:hypothetical protein